MQLRELLYQISEARITLTCGRTEDRLNAKPTSALTPELINEIKEHKMEIIQIMREDEQMRRSGIIQSERQVFELAHEFFGLDDR
jgi:TubC N-terminal docking domain